MAGNLRTVLLNLPLFGLFACAWVADLRPDLMLPSLAVAFAAAYLELLLTRRRARALTGDT